MKNLILSLFTLLLFASYSFSQHTTPEQHAKELTKKLSQELALSNQQAKQLDKMLIQSYVQADEVRKNTNLSKELRKEKLTLIYAERKAQMYTLFTSDQKTRYEAYIQSRKTK